MVSSADIGYALDSVTALSYYARGIFFGIVIVVLVEALIIYKLVKFLLDPRTRISQYVPAIISGVEIHKDIPTDNYPTGILEFLAKALTPADDDVLIPPRPSAAPAAAKDLPPPEPEYASATETCHWANVLAHRFFLALRNEEAFKTNMKEKMMKKMNMKLKGNTYVSYINICELSLGDHAPDVSGVRLIKGVSEDHAVTIELDMKYTGGASIGIQATLVGGITIPVRVTLSSLEGKLRLRCPSEKWSDMLAITFAEDPGAAFTVDSPITLGESEMLRDMVNRVLGKIVRKMFLELWVLPSWRIFFMPLMAPSLEEEIAREKGQTTKLKSERSFKRAGSPSRRTPNNGTLWENRSAFLRSNPKPWTPWVVPDVLHSIAFALDSPSPADAQEVLEYNESLVPPFIQLAREDDRGDGKAAFVDASNLSTTPAATSAIGPIVWKTIKNRGGVHIQRKRVAVNGQVGEVTRVFLRIACDAASVFSILSNPEHMRHVDESYDKTTILRHISPINIIRYTTYNIGKVKKGFVALEIRQRLSSKAGSVSHPGMAHEPAPADAASSSNHEQDSYVVVYRSILPTEGDLANLESHDANLSPDAFPVSQPHQTSSLEDARVSLTSSQPIPVATPASSSLRASSLGSLRDGPDVSRSLPGNSSVPMGESGSLPSGSLQPPESFDPSNLHNVHIYGYYIEPQGPNVCQVTVVSQFSNELNRLEATYNSSRKLKKFIEELEARVKSQSRDADPDGTIQPSTSSLVTGVGSSLLSFAASAVWGTGSSNSGTELRRRKFFGTTTSGKDPNAAASTRTGSVAAAPETHDTDASTDGIALSASAKAKDTKIKALIDAASATATTILKTRRTWLNSGKRDSRASGAESGMDESDGYMSSDIPRLPGIDGRESPLALHDDDAGDHNEDHGNEMFFSASSDPYLDRVDEEPPDDYDDPLVGTIYQDCDDTQDETDGELLPDVALHHRSMSRYNSHGNGHHIEAIFSPSSSTDDILMTSYERNSPIEKLLQPKEVFKIPVVFDHNRYDQCTALELAWQFMVDTEQPITFGIYFVPSAEAGEPDSLRPVWNSSFLPSAAGDDLEAALTILPACPVNAYSRPTSGNICISSLSSGTFYLVWENLQAQKKGQKSLGYKYIVRPVSLSPLKLYKRPKSEVKFSFSLYSEYLISRKSVCRIPLLYDENLELKMKIMATETILSDAFGADHDTTTEQQTLLRWDFSTGGYDIMFGIVFIPQQSLPIENVDLSAVLSASGASAAIPQTDSGGKSKGVAHKTSVGSLRAAAAAAAGMVGGVVAAAANKPWSRGGVSDAGASAGTELEPAGHVDAERSEPVHRSIETSSIASTAASAVASTAASTIAASTTPAAAAAAAAAATATAAQPSPKSTRRTITSMMSRRSTVTAPPPNAANSEQAQEARKQSLALRLAAVVNHNAAGTAPAGAVGATDHPTTSSGSSHGTTAQSPPSDPAGLTVLTSPARHPSPRPISRSSHESSPVSATHSLEDLEPELRHPQSSDPTSNRPLEEQTIVSAISAGSATSSAISAGPPSVEYPAREQAGPATPPGFAREIISPFMKANSQRTTISGSVPITGKYGVYYLVYDNSSSIVAGRTLGLSAEIVSSCRITRSD
ncbi:uncharacterized protein BJ171DRAFT_601097 [Polychytrium aggregatum]|uniref:uncharacterized protein n=1 Tax=Polychytrium aggregatum TaxID=110093 RepID=UPI0022FEF7F4|nr:uncharacterized protein BJ171DRAFT_601097 [Polychytrium aggregatum]KAI9202168.1 hypothetical protein BJ171DRAFT_601097 [Polychytrium aggregatum]